MNDKQYQRRLGGMILVPEHLVPNIPIAIDPPGCGCTECLTGEYVPLDQATDDQLQAMLQGKVANNTGYVWVSDPARKLD